jgi:hypothetical protein
MAKSGMEKVRQSSLTTAAATVANNFATYGRAAAGHDIVGDLLKFNKFGEYVAGRYDDRIAAGTRVVCYMDTLCVGWQRWEGNHRVERVMGPVGAGFVPPKRATLGHLDKTQWERFDDGREKDPWAFTNTLVVVQRKPDGDTFYTFTTTSRGGLDALATLSLAHGEHLRQRPDENPEVTLDVGSYLHTNRAFGEIRFPVFTLIRWVPVADLPPVEGYDPPLVGGGAAGDAQHF